MINSRNEGLENMSYEKWKYPVDPTSAVFFCTLLGYFPDMISSHMPATHAKPTSQTLPLPQLEPAVFTHSLWPFFSAALAEDFAVCTYLLSVGAIISLKSASTFT